MFESILQDILQRDSPSKGANLESTPVTPQRNEGKICFVDGGNAPIFDSSHVRVEAIRVAAVIYNGMEKERSLKEEGFILIRREGNEITVQGYDIDFSLRLPERDSELCLGETLSLERVANLARFIIECRFSARIGRDCSLVRDGTLEGVNTYECAEIKVLLELPIVALAKTKSFSQEVEGEGAWYALLERGEVASGLAKLHPKATHTFRIDTKGDGRKWCTILAAFARDPVFLGYPYPLILVDSLARISKQEQELMKTQFMMEAKNDWKRLNQLATSVNAHTILDHITF